MDEPTLISEMQKFRFGSKIFCSDGEEGVLTRIGLNATSYTAAYIGVRRGRLFGQTVYVPYTTVAEASGEGVYLTITREELAAAKKEVPGDGVPFDSKSIVQVAGSGEKGTLVLVALYPNSGELAYCVTHHLRPGQDTLLRREYIKHLEADHIVVALPESTLQILPPYRSDDELQREVEDILFDLTPLHVDFKGMKVRVLDSVLYLDGNISSSLRGDMVQDQALGVQGLLEVKNRLVSDDRLASELAMVLARDSRTRDLPIGVYPRLGNVRLSGAVHNEQQKVAAEEIAKSFPGVRAVTNDLVIDPAMDMLHVMSSAEGGEAEDKVPGKYIRHTK